MSSDGPLFMRSLSIAKGLHTVEQGLLLEEMQRRLSSLPDYSSIRLGMQFVYERSGIKQRHFELSPLDRPRADWFNAVQEANVALGARALEELFQTEPAAAECDAFIVGCATYVGFPGVSRQLQSRFQFPENAVCLDLGSTGCASGPHAFYLAQMMLERGDARNVCILLTDVMGTVQQLRVPHQVPTVPQLVAHAIAADGAAAVIIGRTPGPGPIMAFRRCKLSTRLLPGSIDFNTMAADLDNQPYLSVRKEIRTAMPKEFVAMMQPEWLDHPILFHPGGPAILRSIETQFPQLSDTVQRSLVDYSENGNVGASSILFVLRRAIREGVKLAPVFRLVVFGPGKVTAVLQFDGVEI